jgi:hypothetical protein
MLETKRIDLNLVSPKYGAPLHFSIYRHSFDLALKMIDEYGADACLAN